MELAPKKSEPPFAMLKASSLSSSWRLESLRFGTFELRQHEFEHW